MPGLATDRAARAALLAALLAAAALGALRLWADAADAPESWWRMRFALAAAAAALAACASCLVLAWMRRADPARALPLAVAATALLASVAAAL